MSLDSKFPEYNCKKRDVRIDNRNYEAYFPSRHTEVKGVVLETRNLNAGDAYANIVDNRTELFVLKKGKKEWEKVYCGSERGYSGPLDLKAIFPLLFSLESDSYRRRWLKRHQISQLKKEIADRQKVLRKLTKTKKIK